MISFPRFQTLPPLTSEIPLVSVVMFCRNRVTFIRLAIESILNQSYPHWELVIQDGASTDGTKEIIESYSDPRIKLISESDSGPFDAMWRCFRRCQGEVIASCLSDEQLLPETLQEGVRYFLCNPEAGAVFGDLDFTGLHGEVIARQYCTEFNFQDYLGFVSTLTLQATLFRRTALEGIGVFSSRHWRTDCADFEIMINLGERYRMDYRPGVVGKYSQFHEGQLSTTPAIGFFCAVGQLTLTNEFFGTNPTRNLLRHIPMDQAYQCIRKLYVRLGVEELRQKLDVIYAGFNVTEPPDSLSKVQQAAGVGKLVLALEMLSRLEATPENWVEIYQTQTEIMEQLCLPREAAASWEWQADRGVPQSAERFLIAQLSISEIKAIEILAKQKKWARNLEVPQVPIWQARSRPASAKIQLAFHAANWSNLEIRLQILPLLAHLDQSQFSLSCYADSTIDPRLFPPGTNVRVVPSTLGDGPFIEQVRQDQVDIFIELSGLGPGHRWGALTARCAPIQISYLGHMATRGIRQIDYQIVDDVLSPPASDKLFTEKLIRLPGCYTCFSLPSINRRSPLDPSFSLSLESNVLPRRLSDQFTFASFAPGSLLNHSQMERWGKLLKLVPGARLLLSSPEFSSSDTRRSIRGNLASQGIPIESFTIVPREEGEISPYLLAQTDLYLDTFPYSDVIGIAYALSQGIASVTLFGDTLSSRLGASLLTAAGLAENICFTSDDYLSKSCELSRKSEKLRGWRETLPGKIHEQGLTNVAGFAKRFQETLLSLVPGPSHEKPSK